MEFRLRPDCQTHTSVLLTAAPRLMYIGFPCPQSPVSIVFIPLCVCACTHMLTSSCKAPNLFADVFFPHRISEACRVNVEKVVPKASRTSCS